MPISLGKVFVDVVPNMANFAKQVGAEVNKNSEKIMKNSAKAGAVLTGLFLVGAKKAVSAASDMNEAISKTQVVFGDASQSVLGWSKTTASSMGIGRQAALDSVSAFAAFGMSAGLTGKDLEGFSKPLVQAAADMASFHNATPEEALQALRSGLSGEAEPLKRFNILMNEASINAAAVSYGIVKATKNTDEIKAAQLKARIAQSEYNAAVKEHGKESLEAQKKSLDLKSANDKVAKAVKGSVPQLTEQQKILARQKLIMESLGPASGDFARTIGGAANQERIAAARTADLTAELGTALLPAYQKLLEVVLKVVNYFSEHNNQAKILAALVGVLGGLFLALAATLKVVTMWQKLMQLGWAKTAAASVKSAVIQVASLAKIGAKWVWAAAKATAASVRMAAAWLVALGPIGWIILGVTAIGAALVVLWKKSETFRAIVTTAWEAVKNAFSAALDFITNNWKTIIVILTGPLGIAVGLVVKYWDDIKGAFLGMFTSVKDNWKDILPILAGPVGLAIVLIRKHWDTIKEGAAAVVSYIGGKWQTILIILTGPLGLAVVQITKHWSAIKGAVNDAVDYVTKKLTSVVTFIGNLKGEITAAARGAFDGLAAAFKSAINWIIGAWNGLDFTIPGFDPPGPGPKFGGFTLGTPNITPLFRGGGLAPGELGLVGERGPEFAIGGMRGTTISPTSGGRAGRMQMTITNWRDGTGYMEVIASDAVAADAARAQGKQRMHR